MIVETSAVAAMLLAESEADDFRDVVRGQASTSLSAAAYLEAGIVIDSYRDPVLSRDLDQLLVEYDIEVVPVTDTQARLARQAYRDFGKGSGHRAQLNFGDCFSYALAIESGEPLLYKGDDFGHTGVRSAL